MVSKDNAKIITEKIRVNGLSIELTHSGKTHFGRNVDSSFKVVEKKPTKFFLF